MPFYTKICFDACPKKAKMIDNFKKDVRDLKAEKGILIDQFKSDFEDLKPKNNWSKEVLKF